MVAALCVWSATVLKHRQLKWTPNLSHPKGLLRRPTLRRPNRSLSKVMKNHLRVHQATKCKSERDVSPYCHLVSTLLWCRHPSVRKLQQSNLTWCHQSLHCYNRNLSFGWTIPLNSGAQNYSPWSAVGMRCFLFTKLSLRLFYDLNLMDARSTLSWQHITQ